MNVAAGFSWGNLPECCAGAILVEVIKYIVEKNNINNKNLGDWKCGKKHLGDWKCDRTSLFYLLCFVLLLSGFIGRRGWLSGFIGVGWVVGAGGCCFGLGGWPELWGIFFVWIFFVSIIWRLFIGQNKTMWIKGQTERFFLVFFPRLPSTKCGAFNHITCIHLLQFLFFIRSCLSSLEYYY